MLVREKLLEIFAINSMLIAATKELTATMEDHSLFITTVYEKFHYSNVVSKCELSFVLKKR